MCGFTALANTVVCNCCGGRLWSIASLFLRNIVLVLKDEFTVIEFCTYKTY